MDLMLMVGAIVLVGFLVIVLSIKGLVVICQPSEVVIFSGPPMLPGQRVGFRSVRGGRGLRIPLLEVVDRMDLTTMSVEVSVTGAYTADGVPINVQGVANVKVDGDSPGLDNAVERLLGKSREEIAKIARETLEGNLRGVLAKLTPEQVNEDKERFAAELIEEAEVDLGRLGLLLDTLKIQTVADDVGYLNSIGRKQTAELIRKARIAEAERRAESAIQAASNLRETRLAQLSAAIDIAKAEANRRVVKARSERGAEVARHRSLIEAQIARATADLEVQKARIEQVKLQLEADVVAPANAYRAQMEVQARAAVAEIRENGLATAAGMRRLTEVWLEAGDQAREIFLLEKFRTLVGIIVGTVKNVHVDQLTFVGGGPQGAGSTAGQVASLVEQLRAGANIDVPEILKRFGIGLGATRAEPD
jgi:flotillin